MKTILKNGNVYINKSFVKKDVLIEDSLIVSIEDVINEQAERIIDATGKHIVPGFVDLHCHLRDPGQTYKEDIASGTKAASKGGFTTVCAMPNTDPVTDNVAAVDYVKRKAHEIGACKVMVIGALTKKSEGKEIAEIATMMESGIIAVSDDGKCVQNSQILFNSMKYAANYNLTVIDHPEDNFLSGKGQINSGKVSARLGLSALSPLSEEVMIARDIMLAESAKCSLHIAHISTAKAVELVRQAKEKGLPVTCEVTPHHLIFTEDACLDFDTNYKVKPPLRTEKDKNALLEALKKGIIDCIATDHAPHADYEKVREFDYAPFGINGLETAFASLYTELVLAGKISLEEIIENLSLKAAAIFKLQSGIVTGNKADLAVLDLDDFVEFTTDTMLSKSKNTPYINKKLQGKVCYTICDGKITWEA